MKYTNGWTHMQRVEPSSSNLRWAAPRACRTPQYAFLTSPRPARTWYMTHSRYSDTGSAGT